MHLQSLGQSIGSRPLFAASGSVLIPFLHNASKSIADDIFHYSFIKGTAKLYIKWLLHKCLKIQIYFS